MRIVNYGKMLFLASGLLASSASTEERINMNLTPVQSLLTEIARDVEYREVSPAAVADAESEFIAAFAGGANAPAEFKRKIEEHELGAITVFQEIEPVGQGVYLIRAEGLPVLLSVPHRIRDLATGQIGALLHEEAPFRAAAFNTVPRRYEMALRQVDADLAHIDVSIFNAFHLAFAKSAPEGRIIQLHGFAAEKRRTRAGRNADAIISSGSREPSAAAIAVTGCLRSIGLRAALFPVDVNELGATTNTNRAALVSAGFFDHFVHVEMSRQLRETLRSEPALRRRFSSCLRVMV